MVAKIAESGILVPRHKVVWQAHFKGFTAMFLINKKYVGEAQLMILMLFA